MNDIHNACISPERSRSYVNGAIAEVDARRVEQHCHGCARCTELVHDAFEAEERAGAEAVEERLQDPRPDAGKLPDWLARAGAEDTAELRMLLLDAQARPAEADRLLGGSTFAAPEWHGAALARRLLALISDAATDWKRRVDIVQSCGRDLTSLDGAEAGWLRSALVALLKGDEHWQVRKAAGDALGLTLLEGGARAPISPQPGVLEALLAARQLSQQWLESARREWEGAVSAWNQQRQVAAALFDSQLPPLGSDPLVCEHSIVNDRRVFTWSADLPLALCCVGIEWCRAPNVAEDAGQAWQTMRAPLLFDAKHVRCVAVIEVPNGTEVRMLPLAPPGSASAPAVPISEARSGSFASRCLRVAGSSSPAALA